MMNKEPKINPVTKSNDFVGIRIEDGEINIYVPQVFRKETNYKRDLLLFLKSISLAKTLVKEKLDKGSNNVDNVWPINSYLWIIKDYLENGFYYNREKVYSNSYSGKIEWKKTMKQIPIYSDGNIIYDKLVTSKMAASNDLIAQIYKLCLKQSIEKIGWVYNYNLKVDVQQIISTSEMISVVRKELNNTFDDIKRMRFNHMLKILKTTEGNKIISNKYTYGIKNYYYVFETMVNKLFDGIKESEKKKYNPNGYWHLNGGRTEKASELRPDTILKNGDKTYILDAKMYQYGCTHSMSDLPDTQSLQKQITYGDYVHNKIKDEHVRNAFILPYNKELDVFKNDENLLRYSNNNLVYFGYADVDWRMDDKVEDYDFIHTFGIDFNYLLRNYKVADTNMIAELCAFIEEKVQLLHFEGVDKFMKLLNSKSILDCDEFEKEIHNKENQEILEGLLKYPNYDCGAIIKYFDEKNKDREPIIKQCELHSCNEMIEYVDSKNGVDLALIEDYLTFIVYGQGYTVGNDYHLVKIGIRIRPYDENREFVHLQFSNYTINRMA